MNRRMRSRVFEALEARAMFCSWHWGEPAPTSLVAEAATPQATDPVANAALVRRINFQPDGANPVPDFYRVDTGAPYGLRSNGLTYGWSADNRDGRDRNLLADQRYDTFHHLQKNGANYSWEIALPNGQYTVRVVAGDAGFFDSVFKINVEGVLTVNGTPTSGSRFVEGTQTVTVADGRLTISNATGAVNNKIAFVEIQGGTAPLPVVSVVGNKAAAEQGQDSGIFTLTRTGSTASALTVAVGVGGTATSGDWDLFGLAAGSVTFAAGSSTAIVSVFPIEDTIVEGTETVSLTLAASPAYSNAFNSSATVNIADNDGQTNLGTLKWTAKAANPSPRAEGYGAAVGGKLYTFGGYLNSQYRPSKVAHVYNPATNTWTKLNDAPLELTHAATASDDRYIYVAGGYPPGAQGPTGPQAFATDRVFRYDTQTDTWTDLPKLPQARGSGQMALIGRSLYFFGGSDATRKDKANTWTLNLDNQSAGWAARASMPAARNHFGSAVVDGKIYAIGGQTGQDAASVFKSDNFRYDPATDTWTSMKSIPTARSHANATTIAHQGRVLVMGGENTPTTQLNKVEAYDPASNTWKSLTNLPRNITAGIAASFGDRIIFSTGAGGGFRGDTWIGTFS